MKRIVLVAALAALSSATAFSQTQDEKPAASSAPAMQEEPKTGQQTKIVLIQGPGQSSVKEDARHCLDHSTNIEIIKCAEAYLPSRRKR
ncbi:MAG: hypothetical protein HY661_16645 [Betaproteobacteria bacterium]|nr:hypothetical protein [Betaproteobacteria bacterium]